MFGPFVLIGVGMGLAMMPVTVAGTAGMVPEEAGLVSGLLNTSRTVGAVHRPGRADHHRGETHGRCAGWCHGLGAHAAAALTDGLPSLWPSPAEC